MKFNKSTDLVNNILSYISNIITIFTFIISLLNMSNVPLIPKVTFSASMNSIISLLVTFIVSYAVYSFAFKKDSLAIGFIGMFITLFIAYSQFEYFSLMHIIMNDPKSIALFLFTIFIINILGMKAAYNNKNLLLTDSIAGIYDNIITSQKLIYIIFFMLFLMFNE